MSAEIANRYKSCLTGVDVDEGSITHAKKVFANDPALNFIHGDGSKISFEKSAFDLICFCDSLHFTRTEEELYAILDKCLYMLKHGGKLAIFCGKECQKAVIWGQNNGVSLKVIDLTETNKELWRNVFIELVTMSSELRNEVPETYERIQGECIGVLRGDGWLPRWLYVFSKQ